MSRSALNFGFSLVTDDETAQGDENVTAKQQGSFSLGATVGLSSVLNSASSGTNVLIKPNASNTAAEKVTGITKSPFQLGSSLSALKPLTPGLNITGGSSLSSGTQAGAILSKGKSELNGTGITAASSQASTMQHRAENKAKPAVADMPPPPVPGRSVSTPKQDRPVAVPHAMSAPPKPVGLSREMQGAPSTPASQAGAGAGAGRPGHSSSETRALQAPGSAPAKLAAGQHEGRPGPARTAAKPVAPTPTPTPPASGAPARSRDSDVAMDTGKGTSASPPIQAQGQAQGQGTPAQVQGQGVSKASNEQLAAGLAPEILQSITTSTTAALSRAQEQEAAAAASVVQLKHASSRSAAAHAALALAMAAAVEALDVEAAGADALDLAVGIEAELASLAVA